MPQTEAPAFTVFGDAGQRLLANIATVIEEFRDTPTLEIVHRQLDGVYNASTLLPWPEPSTANAEIRLNVRIEVTILLRELGILRRSLAPFESSRITKAIDNVRNRVLDYQPPFAHRP